MGFLRSTGGRSKLNILKCDGMNTKKLGKQGEDFAAEYLTKRGCRILARNFRLRLGEIDLVVLDKGCVCFVEVKTRRSYDVPQEAVFWRKQRTLTRVAQAYLKEHYRSVCVRSRFDVVAIEEKKEGKTTVQWIQNAFDSVV